MKMNQKALEKFQEMVGEINTKISELKEDQEEIKKKSI